MSVHISGTCDTCHQSSTDFDKVLRNNSVRKLVYWPKKGFSKSGMRDLCEGFECGCCNEICKFAFDNIEQRVLLDRIQHDELIAEQYAKASADSVMANHAGRRRKRTNIVSRTVAKEDCVYRDLRREHFFNALPRFLADKGVAKTDIPKHVAKQIAMAKRFGGKPVKLDDKWGIDRSTDETEDGRRILTQGRRQSASKRTKYTCEERADQQQQFEDNADNLHVTADLITYDGPDAELYLEEYVPTSQASAASSDVGLATEYGQDHPKRSKARRGNNTRPGSGGVAGASSSSAAHEVEVTPRKNKKFRSETPASSRPPVLDPSGQLSPAAEKAMNEAKEHKLNTDTNFSDYQIWSKNIPRRIAQRHATPIHTFCTRLRAFFEGIGRRRDAGKRAVSEG